MNTSNNSSFVLLTRTKWDEPPRARHQVATALSINYHVSFIEANKSGLPELSVKYISPTMFLLTPKFIVNNVLRFRFPVFNEIYQVWLSYKLKKNDNKIGDSTLLTFDHTSHLFFKKWKNTKIYFCNDDHIRSYGIPLLKKYFRYTENLIVKHADYVFVTSDFLLEKLKKMNSNTFLIKLGAPDVNTSLEFSKNNKFPVKVGIVGFGGKKNNWDIIENLLQNKEQFEIHFFGLISHSIEKKLSKYSNFFYWGTHTGVSLYDKLKKMDVGLAAYSLSDVNSGRTPNKLWLYLAVGLPVVTTNLKNICNWKFPPKSVYKSDDNKDFAKLILNAFVENDNKAFNERLVFAKENSWNSRIQEMLEIINK